MFPRRLVVTFVSLFGIALCIGAPAPKRESDELYACTDVGAELTYELDDGATDTIVIQKVDRKDDAVHVTTGLQLVDRIKTDIVFICSKTGVTMLSCNEETYEPAIPLLKLPLNPNGWTWKSAAPEIVIEGKAKAFAAEKIKVPAGEFSAIRVDFEFKLNGKITTSGSRWYALGIGEIKSVERVGKGTPDERRLKSIKRPR